MPVALGVALCSALTVHVLRTLGNCSRTPMPQGGHSHFGIRSGSVTSEVMKSHEPARASLPVSALGAGERVERALAVGGYIPAPPLSTQVSSVDPLLPLRLCAPHLKSCREDQ